MSYRQNPERLAPDDERDVIGKRAQVDPPIQFGSELVKLGMTGNPQNATINLIFESRTQATLRFFVIGNRFEKFSLSFFNEADRHGFNRLCAAFFTSS